jgi:Arylsulfotransferase (ASST)
VDKGEDGHYLISARYTNTIYKISAIDGSILWRLGGELSDFELLDGFNFTSQHHARLQSENETMTMITLFDNASDDSGRQAPTSRCSSGKLIALDTTTSPMTARLIQQWERPDGLLTDKRGNVQILPNTNVVVGWGDRGYLSEFAPDGRRILDAEYMSSRFGNYRAYKFSFTGSPMEPPALRTFAYGSGMSLADMVSVFYVSWNGATEVAKWNFYGSHKKSGRFSMVGSSAKTGFETSYMSARYIKYTYAEAISSDGRILGKSHVQKTILPNGLDALTDLTIPNIPHTNSTNSTKQQADVTALLPSHQSFGPITVIVIAILLAFSLLGMVAMVYFLWNRKTLLSRGIYAPVTSSDTLESSELSALAYHDQEVEK